MCEELIERAARLMREQTAAYGRLESVSAQLAEALVRGEPARVESLVRAGEGELTGMRSRLVQLTGALTSFAERRAAAPDEFKLGPEARALFESASDGLLAAARGFERTGARSLALANSGSTFAAACIETCGIRPVTYRAPYARRTEGRAWA